MAEIIFQTPAHMYCERRTKMKRLRSFLMSAALGAAAATFAAIPVLAVDQDIVIIHTNDTHCGIEDNLGYEGVAAYEKQVKASTPYVTLVDAGDAIQGAPVGTLTEGESIIRLMNQADYDFAIPGNNEIDYDDVTIAYVGVTTPESITKSTPTYFQDGSGNYIYDLCGDTTGQALYSQIQKTVDSATAAGADYVILVAHLGNEGVESVWTSKNVIAHTNGIHAVIDGHSHETYMERVPNKDGVLIPLSQTGTKFTHIGKMTITPSGDITMEMVDSVLGEDGQKAKDPQMAQVITDVKSQYEESLKTVLGHTSIELTAEDPETGNRAVRNSETNLGDFCADAYRNLLGAEIGIVNGGGIRAGIEAGDITFEDALKVYPFGNMICMVEISGQQLKDALEMGARYYPEENGGFIHVSGMSYTIDASVPSSVQTDEKGNFTGVAGAYRVKDIYVGDEPLDLARTYTLASHNYWLKSGGDGMSMFPSCPLLRDEVMVDVDTITAYIQDFLGGTVGNEYSNPRGQGRITIQNP